MGVVSSAVYRYFPSRDALLTALIVEAYDDVGAAAEAAERRAPRREPRSRVLAVAHALRAWALEHPHEFALIYGSPVPGYAAPEDTIAPAARIPALLIGILVDHPMSPGHGPDMSSRSLRALEPLRTAMAPGVDARQLALGYALWEFLIGAVSIEAFGHQHNVVVDDERQRSALFDAQVRAMCTLVLPDVIP
jgi:AcrR family transcriptional regulator